MRLPWKRLELRAIALGRSSLRHGSPHQHLTGGHVEGIHHPHHHGQNQDMGNADLVGEGEIPQSRGLQQKQALGHQHDAAGIYPIRQGASPYSQEKGRAQACQGDQSQQLRPMAQPIDQPALGHGLHPGSHHGHELAREDQPIVPVPQGPKG